MGKNKAQMQERNDKTITYTEQRPPENHVLTGRTNINDINRRNADQEEQEKKSSYALAGLVVLLIAIIIVAIYFFS